MKFYYKTLFKSLGVFLLIATALVGMMALCGKKTEAAGTYTITYSNGGDSTVTNLPSPTVVGAGQYFQISTKVPQSQLLGNFKGWATSQGSTDVVYTAGQSSVRAIGNMTLYPVWEIEVFLWDPVKDTCIYNKKGLLRGENYDLYKIFPRRVGEYSYCITCKRTVPVIWLYRYGLNDEDGWPIGSFKARESFVVTRYKARECRHCQ